MLNSDEHKIFSAKYELAEKCSPSAMLSKKEFAIVGNLRFISRTNNMLIWLEHEKKYNLGRKRSDHVTVIKCIHLGGLWYRSGYDLFTFYKSNNVRDAKTAQPVHTWSLLGTLESVSIHLLDFLPFCATITKTRLFKYIENFTSKNWKFSDKKLWYFSYFCSKHRFWVLVRTASARRFSRVPTIYILRRNKKNNVYPCKPKFYYIKVGFTGVKII